MHGLKTFERRNVAMLDISDKTFFFFVFGTNFTTRFPAMTLLGVMN